MFEGDVAARMWRAWTCGRPPSWRVAWRMSGVFGQKFGPKNSDTGGRDSSRKYAASSALFVRHVKHVYYWLKPSLARRYMTRGRVNASARKSTSGWSALIRVMAHSQNENAFVCGLSTRKT